MNLELKDDGAGPRHHLEGKPVYCGQALQLRISDSTWAWARYEATFTNRFVAPILYTNFGRVVPDENTVLRWPNGKEAL